MNEFTYKRVDRDHSFRLELAERHVDRPTIWAQIVEAISDLYKPAASRLIGQADLIMIGRGAPLIETENLRRNYLGAVEARYRLADESSMWSLYRRR